MIKVGPHGCKEDTSVVWDEMGNAKLCRIYVGHGDSLLSIQTATLEGTSIKLSQSHGGQDPKFFDSIVLDYPSEFLTSISGTYSEHCVETISFGTNQDTYGPFGTYPGSYSYDIKCGPDFFGFHGRSDSDSLQAIGVYIKPSYRPSTTII